MAKKDEINEFGVQSSEFGVLRPNTPNPELITPSYIYASRGTQ